MGCGCRKENYCECKMKAVELQNYLSEQGTTAPQECKDHFNKYKEDAELTLRCARGELANYWQTQSGPKRIYGLLPSRASQAGPSPGIVPRTPCQVMFQDYEDSVEVQKDLYVMDITGCGMLRESYCECDVEAAEIQDLLKHDDTSAPMSCHDRFNSYEPAKIIKVRFSKEGMSGAWYIDGRGGEVYKVFPKAEGGSPSPGILHRTPCQIMFSDYEDSVEIKSFYICDVTP